MMFSLRRPQYFICHTSCQRWPEQCTPTLRELETLVLEVTAKFFCLYYKVQIEKHLYTYS